MTFDVVIVQKKTALERYASRPLNVDFFEYLERAGQTTEGLTRSHDSHRMSRDALLKTLGRLGLSYKVFTLDELYESHETYFSPSTAGSGFNPSKQLVMSLGGDGTLLHASHYVGGDVRLLGINSCPEHSVGHFCSTTRDTLLEDIPKFFDGQYSTMDIRRLRTVSSRGSALPLGLNDVLLCNRHPAATSRYALTVHRNDLQDSSEDLTERHLSSGIWISTGAGSTAAISSYGLPRLPWTSHKFLCAVREPYMPNGTQLKLQKLALDGDSESITLFSRMRQGMVCVDGADSSAFLGFGESVHIGLPKDCALKLVVGFEGKNPGQ